MNVPENLQRSFENALCGLMNNWRVWTGNDLIRALHIGFDSFNTEICISMLTDREPRLDEHRINPFQEPWPTADWRLTDIASTYGERFPDARDLMAWMRKHAEPNEESNVDEFEYSDQFNHMLKAFFAGVLSGPNFAREMRRFRNLSPDIKLRVEWYFDQDGPIDCSLRDASQETPSK